jgi:hypothetical protein
MDNSLWASFLFACKNALFEEYRYIYTAREDTMLNPNNTFTTQIDITL